jgi:hypothetical protein
LNWREKINQNKYKPIKNKNMKKNIITISLMGFLALSLASCKKTYECHCDKTAGGDEHFDIKGKQADAESECKKKAEGSTVYSSCKLE